MGRKFVKALKGPQPPSHFSLLDTSLLLLLLFFGLYARTFRIAFPNSRVFDEVHFGTFTNKYLNRTYFHDIHPPLGKLLLALAGWMQGYTGSITFSDTRPFPDNHFIGLRLFPASLSGMIPGMAFISMRFFGHSVISSFTTAILLATEIMLIVESRLILVDGFLHFFTGVTILMTAYFRLKPSLISLAFLGISCGCTISVKYTGAGVLIFVFASIFVTYSRCSWTYLFSGFPRDLVHMPIIGIIVRCLIITVISIVILYITFVVHLSILIFRGKGVAFLPKNMRQTLFCNNTTSPPPLIPRLLHVSSPSTVFTLFRVMHTSNMGVASNHTAASKWYQWPLVSMRALTYFSQKYSLVLAANPFIWYPIAIGPLACLMLAIVAYVMGNVPVVGLVIWPVGYFASLLPFALIPRALFVYHYLVPLIFGAFSVTAFVDVLLSNNLSVRGCVFTLWLVFVIGSWVFFSPWCYAMEGTNWRARTWYRGMFRS